MAAREEFPAESMRSGWACAAARVPRLPACPAPRTGWPRVRVPRSVLNLRSTLRPLACVLALATASAAQAADPAPRAPDTVVVQSGELKLRGLLFHPAGRGPFPAVLFNHGSGHARGASAGGPDQRHPELLGPVFARHGYLFLYLYRRGDGLSAGQGMAAGDVMDQAMASGGQDARNQVQLHLLETDETDDAMAGLTYLRALPEVDPARVAVVGHSFGGSVTLLLAARDPSIRAIVTFAAVGYSWDRSPQLRAQLTAAVERMSAAVFLISAANDFSLGPEKSWGRRWTDSAGLRTGS